MSNSLLKLRALDSEDVQVISAVLQDAIAPVCDMIFKKDEKNFVMVVHRLRREKNSDKELERICCAVNILGVEQVQTHNVDLRNHGQMLELLALLHEDKALTFVFAADARIRLTLGHWSLVVEDFAEPWPAFCNPCHEEAASR